MAESEETTPAAQQAKEEESTQEETVVNEEKQPEQDGEGESVVQGDGAPSEKVPQPDGGEQAAEASDQKEEEEEEAKAPTPDQGGHKGEPGEGEEEKGGGGVQVGEEEDRVTEQPEEGSGVTEQPEEGSDVTKQPEEGSGVTAQPEEEGGATTEEGEAPTDHAEEPTGATEQQVDTKEAVMEGDGTGEDKTQTEGPAETGEGEQAPHQLATSEEAPTSPQPMEDQGLLVQPRSPSAHTPQPVPLEDILEEEEEEEVIDRETLIEELKEALKEQEGLKVKNSQQQHKIAEYLSRKKTEERPDPGRNVTDQEKRYNQCMKGLEKEEKELLTMQKANKEEEKKNKEFQDRKLAQVDQAVDEFEAYKKEKALAAVNSRSGKKLTPQEVDQYQSQEKRKEQEVTQARLENIRLQNKTQKLEALIKQKEQLAEGLHMIDFEQLKINNVDLNEKIEERNEDILKLKRKVTATVQVLTHVKEKLQFLQAENSEKRAKLREVEAVVAKKRDHLTRMKQARDCLRTDNLRLRQKGGLVSHSGLLRDFEEKRDQSEELEARLEALQQRHSELTVLCDGLRKKTEQARTLHPHM